MNKVTMTIICGVFLIVSAISAHADLHSFMTDLNRRALEDISRFNVKLSTQFGLPLPDLRVISKAVDSPADVFMCLQLSQMTNASPEKVLATYRKNQGKGWGVIAKKMGIKPGSAEFHNLKRGNFKLVGLTEKKPGKGQGKNKGKGQKK